MGGASAKTKCGSDIRVVPSCEVKGDRPGERIAQHMAFRRAPAARATDGLRVLAPPFPTDAERCALIDVLSSASVTQSLPAAANAPKIAAQRSAFANRLNRL